MGLRELERRIRILESLNHEQGIVELLILEDGKERHKCVTLQEATMMAYDQDMDYKMGTGEKDKNRIIKVISGDNSGMLNAIISCEVEKGSALKVMETEIKEEEKWHGSFLEYRPEPILAAEPEPERVEKPKEKISMRDEIMQAIKRRKERERQEKGRENKTDHIDRTSAECERVSHI